MSDAGRTARRSSLAVTAFACCILLGGCVFDAPITITATRKVDQRLLGVWEPKDGDGRRLTVVRLDHSAYIALWGSDFLRVHHSDLAQVPFVSAELLGDEVPKPYEAPTYIYMTWALSEDGTQLELRHVKGEEKKGLIPRAVSKDSAQVQKLLIKNLQNPDLFDANTDKFTKAK